MGKSQQVTLGRKKRKRKDDYRHPEHLAWVRQMACSVPGCAQTPVHACHVRAGINTGRGGTGLKSHDAWAVPLCWLHHRRQHDVGEREFERETGIDMRRIAQELSSASPVAAVQKFSEEMNND